METNETNNRTGMSIYGYAMKNSIKVVAKELKEDDLKELQNAKYVTASNEPITPMDVVVIEFNPNNLVTLKNVFEDAINLARVTHSPDEMQEYQNLYRKIFIQVAAQRTDTF